MALLRLSVNQSPLYILNAPKLIDPQLPGLPIAAGSIGILSYDLDGIQTVFRAILEASPWTSDIDMLEIPWRQEKHDRILARGCSSASSAANGRLVFGIMNSDSNVSPHPPIRIALQVVKTALIESGYEVCGRISSH